MVLESELVDRLREFLRTSDPSKTTTAIVRQKLEEDFGVDLAEMFIREQIDNFLICEFENKEKDVKGDEEEGQKAEVEEGEGSSGGEDAEEDAEEDEGPINAGDSSTKRVNTIEEDFGVDLVGKKMLIREQIDNFLISKFENKEKDVKGVEEEGQKAEVEEKKGSSGEEDAEEDEGPINAGDSSTKRVNMIEEDFGVDLAGKKMLIREQIDNFLISKFENKEKEVKGDDEEGQKAEAEEKKGSSGEDAEEDEGPINAGNSSTKRSKSIKAEVKKRGGGFTKLCSLSQQLQEFLGVPELARTGVVKQLWAYIRENNLQDPSNKRKIVCDERLQKLFKVNKINMFKMNKTLSKHIWPLSSGNDSVKSTPTPKPMKKLREDDSSRKGKGQKGVNRGFLSPFQLSDSLTEFIGIGENTLPRSIVMADSESGGLGIELMLEMVEQFGKSYDEMVSHRESLSHNKSLLEYIKQHFFGIQKSLQEKFDELENKERAFEKKKAEHRALVEEQKTAVDAKEQVLWDHLQELKDAAVSAITEARMKIKVACPVLDNMVHSSANEFPNVTFPAQEGYSPVNKVSKLAEALTGKVEPRRPHLKQLCEQMDAKGLLKLISENRKNFAAISDELPLALRSAPKPADMVLETIEGFYSQNLSNTNLNAKDSNKLLILRRSCLLLMESAAPLLGMSEPGGQPGGDHLLSSENKHRAKVIADEWNLKLAEVDLDASNGYSLEAQAFLQLLATFSISSEFNKDELCKLVVAVSRRRRQAPEFCRALDLTHKTQDVIAAVIAKGRLIDAVHLSHSFQLTEVFPLVPLLNQYFDDAMEKWGRTIAAGAEKEALNQELGALKAVVKCVEEYKLQVECPLDGLKNRIKEIEKAKTDKKRAAESRKNPRANGGSGSRRDPIAVDNRLKAPYDDRAVYYGGGDRYPGSAPPACEVAGHVPYGHQVNAPRPPLSR